MFECKMCGICCRNIRRYKDEIYPIFKRLLGETIPNFDIEDDNGVCVHLTEDNKCSIYEERPILCNTGKMFELLSMELGVTKDELYKAQALSCEINQKHNTYLNTQEYED